MGQLVLLCINLHQARPAFRSISTMRQAMEVPPQNDGCSTLCRGCKRHFWWASGDGYEQGVTGVRFIPSLDGRKSRKIPLRLCAFVAKPSGDEGEIRGGRAIGTNICGPRFYFDHADLMRGLQTTAVAARSRSRRRAGKVTVVSSYRSAQAAADDGTKPIFRPRKSCKLLKINHRQRQRSGGAMQKQSQFESRLWEGNRRLPLSSKIAPRLGGSGG
jgi:hypothetical protein